LATSWIELKQNKTASANMLGAIAGAVLGSVYEFDPVKTKDFELLTPEIKTVLDQLRARTKI